MVPGAVGFMVNFRQQLCSSGRKKEKEKQHKNNSNTVLLLIKDY